MGPSSLPGCSLARSRLIQVRRYWDSSRNSGPQIRLSSSRCNITRPTLLASCSSSADARYEFVRIEWLGDVVVGAALQAFELVRISAPRRQHDDRQLALGADS